MALLTALSCYVNQVLCTFRPPVWTLGLWYLYNLNTAVYGQLKELAKFSPPDAGLWVHCVEERAIRAEPCSAPGAGLVIIRHSNFSSVTSSIIRLTKWWTWNRNPIGQRAAFSVHACLPCRAPITKVPRYRAHTHTHTHVDLALLSCLQSFLQSLKTCFLELLKTGFINVVVGWEDKLWDKADRGVGMEYSISVREEVREWLPYRQMLH